MREPSGKQTLHERLLDDLFLQGSAKRRLVRYSFLGQIRRKSQFPIQIEDITEISFSIAEYILPQSSIAINWTAVTADDVREIPLPDPAPKFEAADITDRLIRWLQRDRSLLATRLREYFDNGAERNSLNRKRAAPDYSDHKVIAAVLTQALTDKDIFEPRRQKRPAWFQARFPTRC